MKELADVLEDVEHHEIKERPIEVRELDALRQKVGSYEALFSKRARQYRALGLHQHVLSERDYRQLILENYTFLKRPVIVVGEEAFVGSSKKSIAAAKEALMQK